MGLFSSMYTKEGKGVSKDAPKKKSFIVFFEIYFRKFWQLCVANVLYIIVALPLMILSALAVWVLLCMFIDPSNAENQQILLLLDVVFTLILALSHPGLSQTGLTYITRNFARESHAFVSHDFWQTIKKNWKQSLIISVLFFVVDTLNVLAAFSYYTSSDSSFGNILLLALTFCAFYVLSCMKYYISIMLITFNLKTSQILKNAVIFTFVGVWRNLLLFFVFALCTVISVALLALGTIGYLLLVIFVGLIYPAFRSLLIQYVIFPTVRKLMIDPYYADKPLTEDLEMRRELRLIDEEALAAETGVEAVFTDRGETPAAPKEDTAEDAFRRSGKWKAPESKRDDDSII